jgi:HEPN domain-containing protein/predicted nucleotidyltransferase
MAHPPHVSQEEIQRALWALARAYAEALRQSLGERLVAVALFGSVARGEAGPSSDVDLLVIAEGLPARRLERYGWLEEADRAVEPQLKALWGRGITAEVSVILKTPEEAMRITPLYLDLTEDAYILYEREPFLSSILERLRGRLKALGAQRKRQGAVRYWDLKPDFRLGEGDQAVTSGEMARADLSQAEEILREVERLYQRRAWNLVVRRSQEVVELALKGLLRGAGVEVPRTHDVSVWLKSYRDRFPASFQQEIDRLASISRRLRLERELSFYGDEDLGAPPQKLYREEDAKNAMQEARWVLERCLNAWSEMQNS